MEGGRVAVAETPAARKSSGSYYTPEELVALIIERAVGPLVSERVDAFATMSAPVSSTAASPRRLIEARTRVADYLDPGQDLSLSAIARRAGVHVGDVSRALQLAFLAPDLVEAILDGTQPVALTPERLKRAGELPLLWEEQRAMLGVDELEGGDLRRRSGAGRDARRGELA